MKARHLFAAAALLTGLAACTNDEYMNQTGNVSPTFTGSITSTQVSTRAYDQTWENGDRIGISGANDIYNKYQNVPYITSGGNTFTPDDKENTIYYEGTGEAKFTAYYPYNDFSNPDTAEGTTIKIDTRNQGEQKKFDFLFTDQPGTGSKADNTPVSLNFSHKMAKICLTVKEGAGVTLWMSDFKFYLNNLIHDGEFDYTDGSVKTTGSAVSDDSFLVGETNAGMGEEATFTQILLPQEFTDNKLQFTAVVTDPIHSSATTKLTAEIDLNQATGGDVTPKNALQAGVQYNIPVILNKTGMEFGTVTIEKWKEVTVSNDIEAGMSDE